MTNERKVHWLWVRMCESVAPCLTLFSQQFTLSKRIAVWCYLLLVLLFPFHSIARLHGQPSQIECEKIDGVDNGGKLARFEREKLLNSVDNRPNRGRIEKASRSRLTPSRRLQRASDAFHLIVCGAQWKISIFASLRDKNGSFLFSITVFYGEYILHKFFFVHFKGQNYSCLHNLALLTR